MSEHLLSLFVAFFVLFFIWRLSIFFNRDEAQVVNQHEWKIKKRQLRFEFIWKPVGKFPTSSDNYSRAYLFFNICELPWIYLEELFRVASAWFWIQSWLSKTIELSLNYHWWRKMEACCSQMRNKHNSIGGNFSATW